MEKVILKAKVREGLGKGACKRLRKEGKIPSAVYKDGKAGVNVQVDGKELRHALHTEAGENAIITMEISSEGKNITKTVIVKEIQLEPVNDGYFHVDFHEISLKEKLKVNVPVVIKGESAGVKEEEGVLAQLMWEIEVQCLPTEIPEHIEVNVEELHIGDAIHVREIAPISGVTILDDPEQVVVSVNMPQKEEDTDEEASSEEGEEPEVMKKGKKEEEGEESEAEAEAEAKAAGEGGKR